MKKRIMLCALCLLLGLMMLCSGCEKKESADDYLGRLITRAKENEGELQSVLEMGIADAKSSNDFVIDFPDELKESYEAFLKEALNQVQFELNKADKESNDTYIIRVTYEPIDIAATTQETDARYVENISGTDLTTEMKNLLEEDTKLLSNAKKQQKKSRTITVKKSGDSYKVSEKDITALLQDALQGIWLLMRQSVPCLISVILRRHTWMHILREIRSDTVCILVRMQKKLPPGMRNLLTVFAWMI